MAAPRITLTGDREVRRALQALGSKLRRTIIVQAMDRAMDPVLSRAESEAPVDTGHLKHEITKTVKGEQKGRMRVDVGVRRVLYAGFEEYGAKGNNHPADPFMERTFDSESHRARDTAERLIRDSIEREARSS